MSQLTLFQLKIAQETVVKAQQVTTKIMAEHEKEVKALASQIKSAATEKQVEKFQARWAELHERGRRITHHNVLRYAIETGLAKATVGDALAWLTVEGIPLGRPSKVG